MSKHNKKKQMRCTIKNETKVKSVQIQEKPWVAIES